MSKDKNEFQELTLEQIMNINTGLASGGNIVGLSDDTMWKMAKLHKEVKPWVELYNQEVQRIRKEGKDMDEKIDSIEKLNKRKENIKIQTFTRTELQKGEKMTPAIYSLLFDLIKE